MCPFGLGGGRIDIQVRKHELNLVFESQQEGEEEESAGRKAFASKKDDDSGSPTVNQDACFESSSPPLCQLCLDEPFCAA